MEKIKKVPTSIPVTYSIDDVGKTDDRFTRVKIDVLNAGRNYNYTVFRKDVVDKSIDTLGNIPILGFLRADVKNGLDFKGHEYETEYVDGEYKEKYYGSAYGLIPENSEYEWIEKENQYGEKMQTLSVIGYLWNKFDDVIGILDRDKKKSVSMEISDIDGDFDDEGYFVFSSFKFDGICILGKDVEPAMEDANITAFSKHDEFRKLNSEMISEFKKYMQGGNNKTMEKEKKEIADVTVKEITDKYEKLVKDFSKLENENKDYSDKLSKKEEEYNKIAREFTDVKTEYDTLKAKYDKYEKAKALEEQKKEEERKNEIFNRFDTILSDVADYSKVKNDREKFTSDEIETKCAVMFTKKSLSQPKSNDLGVKIQNYDLNHEDSFDDISEKINEIYK